MNSQQVNESQVQGIIAIILALAFLIEIYADANGLFVWELF